MENGNIGVLLHKLTKYQTLLGNSPSSQKNSIYNQKISQYSNKLEKMGVSKSNLRQMGGLSGGVVDYTATLKKLIDIQSNNIQSKLAAIGTPGTNPADISPFTQAVQDVEDSVSAASGKYNQTITNLVSLIRELLKQLILLEEQVSKLPDTIPGVDLATITNKINAIKSTLDQFGTEDSIAAEYVKLLIQDLNDPANTATFVEPSGKHTNLLSVELRQLASMIGFDKASDPSTDAAFVQKLVDQFKNTPSDTDLTRINDPILKNALEKLINGDGASIKSLSDKLRA